MPSTSVHLTDWKRILFGNAPASFLIEVFVRTSLIYLALIGVLRILGKRMAGQLTIFEMSVMITLGSIVSPPMQVPDKGIALGVLLLLGILLLQRGFGRLGFESRRLEVLSQGDVSPLVKNGIILTDALRRSALSREQLYAALREKQVYQLGQVKRAYLEACGLVTVIRYANPMPGLCVLPKRDAIVIARCMPRKGFVACTSCGHVMPERDTVDSCGNCHERGCWVPAVG